MTPQKRVAARYLSSAIRKKRMKLYHGTTAENAAMIVRAGFDLGLVKPVWKNDLAVSTLTTYQAVKNYMKPGTVILEMVFSGNVISLEEAYKLGEGAKSAKEYTNRMISLGIDAVSSVESGPKLVYVYDPSKLSNIRIVEG